MRNREKEGKGNLVKTGRKRFTNIEGQMLFLTKGTSLLFYSLHKLHLTFSYNFPKTFTL